MENSFSTETTETRMAVDNLDLFPNNNVAEDGKE